MRSGSTKCSKCYFKTIQLDKGKCLNKRKQYQWRSDNLKDTRNSRWWANPSSHMVMMLLIMELWVGPTLAPDRCLALLHISPPNYCSILIFKVTAIHLKQHWIFQKMQISSIEAYLVNIVKLGRRCGILWFFNLSSAETLILSLKFDQFDPFCQLTQKVCQKCAT